MSIRPSSLPMLQQCPCFEAGDTSVFAEEGTQRHQALAAVMMRGESGALDFLDALDDESREGVEWAADYIRIHAPTSDFPLRIEEHVNPIGPNLEPLFENGGTADYICGPVLLDFKWRPRNHDAQMAAYALALFEEGHEVVTVHVLFGQPRRAQRYTLDEQSAKALVYGVIARANDPNKQPSPCDYCGWCVKRLTCKPYLQVAKRVAEGYADPSMLAQVQSWHPSDMQSADELALALTIARKLLSKWCESVEFHAKKAAMAGMELPGYALKEKSGKSHITDAGRAYELLGLPPAEFLKCCTVRPNTSKKYPERVGVIDVYAKAHEMKSAPAKRAVKQKLSDLITTGKPTMALIAVGGEAEENENET